MDAYPLKAQFISNDEINIALEFLNSTEEHIDLNVFVKVERLLETVEYHTSSVSLEHGEARKVIISLAPKDVDFEGYGADIYLLHDGETVQEYSTSFDVVSDWRKATRYGFLSDFGTEDGDDGEDVKSLCKYHLNLVQFYDWMYRHDELVPPMREFTDLMGRKTNIDAVKQKVSFCHEYGMKAIAYGAVYAASTEFFKRHEAWGFYNSSGEVYNFIDIFRIMNISPDSPWHGHIIGEYRNAVEKVGFDGIHMDTYGFPKTAVSRLNGEEKTEHLEELFPALINNTRKELEKVDPDLCLIFNNVGNWPVDTVAGAKQDAVYIEVWEPYERYHHIQQIIQWAKHYSKGKPVILAAYLKPFMQQESNSPEEARMSALLLTSIIAANGGYHMLLGEKDGILTQGYYVDYSKMDGVTAGKLRSYYDFIIRYSRILFDKETRDVSMTHCRGDNLEYVFENVEYSPYGEPGKVWVDIREKPGLKTVSFINLTNNGEDYWNKGKNNPLVQNDIIVKVQVPKAPKHVYAASPDANHGRPVLLDYLVWDGDRGKVLTVKITGLHIWSLLVIDFE